MATHTVNTRIARQPLSRSCSGGWLLAHRLYHWPGHRYFPAHPATDAAFAEFYRMTTADQIDAAAGDLMARGPMTQTRSPPRHSLSRESNCKRSL